MYLLFAPYSSFGFLPRNTEILTHEVKFSHNYAYCPKHYWAKYHILKGCIDVTPRWMINKRKTRQLKTILIIATGGIGDSAWCMPFAAELKRIHPEATIVVAANTKTLEIWKNVPYVTAAVTDLYWNLHSLIMSADEVYDFAGIATSMPKYKNTDPVDATFLAAGLQIPKDKKLCLPKLVVTAEEGKQAQKILKDYKVDVTEKKLITIGLEASTSNRDWSFAYTKMVTAAFISSGYSVAWLGETPDYEPRNCDAVTNSLGQANLVRSTSIRQAMAIIALSDLYIGPASGLMVLSTALGIPTIGLFGAFDPGTRAKYYNRFAALWHKIQCSPCGEHWTECRNGHPPPCMKSILPDEVISAANEIIKKYPRSLVEKLPLE